jgi:FkbM family methyltransferase
MSRLVGAQGRVVAIEASPETFKILKMNTGSCKNVEIRNMAVCDVPESRISFYVFPFYFSELNTLVPEQYDPEGWIHDVKPEKVEVPTITIEAIINENRKPRLIKIDVEGAEDKVMNGSMHVIESLEGTDIIMEYNVTEQHQQPYIDAENSLRAAGYEAHFIDHDGSLVYWSASLLDYMKNRNLRSENVVFKKKDSITR